MEQMITIHDKRDFLKWFLDRYQVKRRECVWLLNYVMSDDHLLGLFHFVESVKDCKRSMSISLINSSDKPFVYYKHPVTTEDPEKAFHDIRLNRTEPIFVKINFNDSAVPAHYINVLEEHPHTYVDIHDRFGNHVEKVIQHVESKYMLESLYEDIDKALENGDKETFTRLTEQLRMMKNP